MTVEVVQSGASKIAIIRIVNPPVNAVSAPVRAMVVARLEEVARDNSVAGVVLCGEGRIFASGIPLSEVEQDLVPPALGELCQRIEMFPKPVVVLMEGHVASAGLEMALAAHGRVATPGAKLGLPDFRLGLSPGGGATQRLPRLIGAGAALEMLLQADPHLATSELCRPLVDRVVEGPAPLDAAVALAAEMAEVGQWTRTRDRTSALTDPVAFQTEVQHWRAKFAEASDEIAIRIIETVEAALLLPFEAGLALEAACFDDLRVTTRSRGLRRSRQSEQQANRLTAINGPKVTEVAVLGQQSGMVRIAGAFVMQGLSVTLFSAEEDKAVQARADLLTRSRQFLAKHGEEAIKVAASQVRASDAYADLATAQVVIVVMPTGPDSAVTQCLDALVPHLSGDAVVLCVGERAGLADLVPTALAGRVFGLTLAERTFVARAVEVTVPDGASRPALALAQSALWRINRVVVRGRAGRPMLLATLFDTMMAAADGLVRRGVKPSQIEQAMLAHGFARGPYAVLMQADSAAYLSRTLGRRSRMGLSHRVLTEQIAPVAEGKTSAVLDFAAVEMFEHSGPDLSEGDIIGAMTAALANAGCHLIAEGAVYRPMQVDALMLHGFGYPRSFGGPMAEADITGLGHVLDRCKALEATDPLVWAPHPMLQDFYVNGLSFLDLDRRITDAKAA